MYSDILQNAPLCSQIFKIFFVSGGKGELTPNQNPADVPVIMTPAAKIKRRHVRCTRQENA